jgi:4-carboxymuconolactone decarboxylase
MARVPYVDPGSAPPATAKALGRLPDLHVFTLLANAESAFVPWLRFGGALLTDLALDPLLRELAILQVGRLAARYEWDQHVAIALACGATEEQIAALDRGDLAPFEPSARAVREYVADLVRDGEVPDDRYAALAAHLGTREIVEVSMVAGTSLGLARIMTALRIDADEPAPLGAVRMSS